MRKSDDQLSGRVVELPNATKKQRKAMSRVVSAIMASRAMTFEAVYVAAIGSYEGYGLEDKKNFSKGDLAQRKAAKFFRWIVENHLALGCDIAPEVFDPSLLTKWRDFVRTHGIYGQLTHHVLGQMGLTERSANIPIAETPIHLAQDYILELECGIAGTLLSLESTGGHTYPFSLHPDCETPVLDITSGKQKLPLDHDGNLSPLMEKNDDGLRSYIFIIAEPDLITDCAEGLRNGHPIGLDKLDQIALAFKDIDPTRFEVHCLNVIFK